MEDNQNILLVKKIYGFFGAGNITGVIDMLSDDVLWIIPSIKNYPPSGTHKGKDEVNKFFSSLGNFVDTLSFDPKVFAAVDNTVFVQGSYKFKVKKNGNLISSDWVEVFLFDNEKIIQYEEYTDTAAFQNAFD
ncbi:MAG: nuclear transport factor 2 family protein [bacterium]